MNISLKPGYLILMIKVTNSYTIINLALCLFYLNNSICILKLIISIYWVNENVQIVESQILGGRAFFGNLRWLNQALQRGGKEISIFFC